MHRVRKGVDDARRPARAGALEYVEHVAADRAIRFVQRREVAPQGVVERLLLKLRQQHRPPREKVPQRRSADADLTGGEPAVAVVGRLRHVAAMRVGVELHGQRDLLEAIRARNLPRRLAGCLHRRQQQGDQHADDRDDEVLVDPRADVRVGDIVVARHPFRTDVHVIKRLVELDDEGRARLEGDNPSASTDSRTLGGFSRRSIVGRVSCRLPRGKG